MTNPNPSRTIEQIIENIKTGDDIIRNKAFEEIIEFKHEAILPLITLLSHPDEQIRDSVIWALCEMREFAEPALIQELSNKNPVIRESAAFCLGICKNPHATKPLISLLKDEDEKVRETAAWSLVKVGHEDSNTINEIIHCLYDDSNLVRETAQWILEHIGEPAIEPLLQHLMQSSRNSQDIIQILSKIASPKLDRVINLLTTTRDIQQLSYIIQLLGKLREPDAINHLMPFVNHENRQIIITTIDALINIGELTIEPLFNQINDGNIFPINEMMPLFIRYKKSSVPKLIQMMNSPLTSLRIFAARALGIIEDKRAIEPLIQGLSDPNPQFVEACARALSAFKNKMSSKPLTDVIMNEYYPIIKSNAIYALAQTIDCMTAMQLLQNFDNAPLIVKKRLLQLASYFPGDDTEKLLQQGLSIDDEDCKMLSLQGLKHIGTEKSIDCVRDAIINENPFISDEARTALKEIIERKQRGNIKTLDNYDDFV
ncbi:MAG: HEAT repeat domain-containing protein [Spirochaetes bacterium]|nr:HEAT repeat domain-containing protein [Spirochaetota bacterium]